MGSLKSDPWRGTVGFSAEVAEANARIFGQPDNDAAITEALAQWLQHHQPCLFGRIASKSGFLSYCVLGDSELSRSDEFIRDKIQEARTDWTRGAYSGRTSGFIILAASERLANAVPDGSVKELATRLCSLYLLTEVRPDKIFHDDVWLELPGQRGTTWQWHAGVNYFCTHGDKRWWNDHRIPGGMAFSINSVGHMVKAGILARGMSEVQAAMGAPPEDWAASKIDSLPKALVLAMRTISMASHAISGRATELLTLPAECHGVPPVPLPDGLANKNYNEYLGHYHTDYTVPSEYFVADVERPSALRDHILDFTYLFRPGVDNPEFTTMGEGRRIREDAIQARLEGIDDKEMRSAGKLPTMADCERLQRCLARI